MCQWIVFNISGYSLMWEVRDDETGHSSRPTVVSNNWIVTTITVN